MIRNVVVQLWTGGIVAARLSDDHADPTPAELDAIATAWTAANDGVRPVVRVLEASNLPSIGARGPAGSPPPRRTAA